MSVSLSQQLDDLRQGRAALALTGYRVIEVTGSDAIDWLDALVTTGVARMEPGEARNSFLLQATGRIRASFIVVRTAEGAMLIQPPGQPSDIDALLAMYRLSSDVALTPNDDTVFFVATRSTAELRADWRAELTQGSSLLPEASEQWLIGASAERANDLREALASDQPLITDSSDMWTALGLAAFPADLSPDSSPLEAAEQLGDAIDHDKGCYLGQEAIAKTRNFGRTPFEIRSFHSPDPVNPGDPVLVDSKSIGTITSVVADDTGYTYLARVRR